jgi:hypothetical protein
MKQKIAPQIMPPHPMKLLKPTNRIEILLIVKFFN